MSYFGMSKRLYADRKAPDGVIATGWRKVKKGGRVKFGGAYYTSPRLQELAAGELVHVSMGDYWQGYVLIERGVFGCSSWYCDAAVILDGKAT